jgi:hypothetical protein
MLGAEEDDIPHPASPAAPFQCHVGIVDFHRMKDSTEASAEVRQTNCIRRPGSFSGPADPGDEYAVHRITDREVITFRKTQQPRVQ